MKKVQGLLVMIMVLSFQISIAQTASTLPAFVKDSMDSYVERALKDWKIPGASVAIVKDGKVVFIKGYGVREMGKPEKVDEHTLFMIGSNTKAFTATVLAMMHQEKKLSLDDKVQKWWPEFKQYDPWVAKEANIRDLLCHRLGFETFQGDFMFFDSDLTKEEVFDRFGRLKPLHSFRSTWGYTNAAFGVAGEVIQKASGKSWAENIREKIFVPLQMTNSLATSAEILTANNKAAAHTVDNNILQKIPYGKIDNIGPAGSISSSASDMTHWMIAQLNNGKFNDKQALVSGIQQHTWMPHSILGNGGTLYNKGHFSLYGLGWMLEEYSGRRIVSHTGGVNGFVTSVTLIPEEKLGIVVLTNTDMNSFYEALKWEIMDAYLGNTYRNYSKAYLGFQSAENKQMESMMKLKRDTIAKNPATELKLAEYAGEYEHELYGKMNIKVENGKLIMRFEHHKDLYGTLEPLGGNRFLCTYSASLYGIRVLPFTVENGKVKSVRITVAGFVEHTPYDFIKK